MTAPTSPPDLATGAAQEAPPEGANLDELLARTQRFVRNSIRGTIAEPLEGAKHSLVTGAVGLTLTVVFLGSACLLLLAAALIALAQYLSPAGACLVVGLFALLAGALSLLLATRR